MERAFVTDKYNMFVEDGSDYPAPDFLPFLTCPKLCVCFRSTPLMPFCSSGVPVSPAPGSIDLRSLLVLSSAVLSPPPPGETDL